MSNQITAQHFLSSDNSQLFLIKGAIPKAFTIPESVTELILSKVQISEEFSIPNKINELNLSKLQVSKKFRIPDSIIKLVFFKVQMPAEFTIPKVTELSFSKTRIKKSLKIPDSVTYLTVSHSQIPENFVIPDSVTHLDFSYSQIPENFMIPNRVTHLILSHSQIPKKFEIPNRVVHLELSGQTKGNPYSRIIIPQSVTYLYLSGIQVPKKLKGSSKEPYLYLSDAQMLATFIQRMKDHFPTYLGLLETYFILAIQNDQFQDTLFKEIETASTNCKDRPLYFFSRLSMVAAFYQAKQENRKDKMLQALLALHSAHLIEQQANQISEPEALEIALLLQLKLKEDLHLPTAITDMGHEKYTRDIFTLNQISFEAFEKTVKNTCLKAQATFEQKKQIVLSSPHFQNEYTQHFQELQEKYSEALFYLLSPNEKVSQNTKDLIHSIVEKDIKELSDQEIREASDTISKKREEEKQQCLSKIAEEFIKEAIDQ